MQEAEEIAAWSLIRHGVAAAVLGERKAYACTDLVMHMQMENQRTIE